MSGYHTGTTYQENAVLGSSPERLVPLMYDHLLVSLKRGRLFIEKGDVRGKHTSLGKAADIVAELLSALDFEGGGELATRLASLYGFWSREISTAGRELDAQRLLRVIDMVATLRETWEEAVRVVEAGEAGPPPSARA